MHDNFMDNMQKVSEQMNPNVSVTENGAVGYKTTGKALLDLNFKLSSMRNMLPDQIWHEFLKAYNENPALAVIWLFFARDARGGNGERRTFRIIFERLAYENPDLTLKLLNLVPEYGRWDDLLEVYDGEIPCEVRNEIVYYIQEQLRMDADNALHSKPVSLLCKWLPSLNTSSKETRRKAEMIRNALGMTPRQYRKTLSELRKYLDVTERKMSSNNWGEINYEFVPSKAGLNYRNAFSRHDGDRYNDYLTNVKSGNANMNADVLYPYEIVHAYMGENFWCDNEVKPFDPTLELKWKSLPNCVNDNGATLVVVDGSGSMSARIGGTNLTCHDVARSLGIYFAERLAGAFKNRFITFSATPKIVGFNGVESLKSKIEILIGEDDCSNTNIEKTFDLILKTAVDNHMKQEEIPANILIVSDMEFDNCTHFYDWSGGYSSTFDGKLFNAIAGKWAGAGYKLPRLVFWNVCSRTGTIPVKENELGVALLSGFSPAIADMVMSGEIDPYKLLVDKLMSERYAAVRAVVMPS